MQSLTGSGLTVSRVRQTVRSGVWYARVCEIEVYLYSISYAAINITKAHIPLAWRCAASEISKLTETCIAYFDPEHK